MFWSSPHFYYGLQWLRRLSSTRKYLPLPVTGTVAITITISIVITLTLDRAVDPSVIIYLLSHRLAQRRQALQLPGTTKHNGSAVVTHSRARKHRERQTHCNAADAGLHPSPILVATLPGKTVAVCEDRDIRQGLLAAVSSAANPQHKNNRETSEYN